MSYQLPISRVKKLIKFDPDVHLITGEFSNAMSTACELFIRAFAREIAIQTKVSGRKTVTATDVENCIASVSRLEFLDGALEGWGEIPPKPQLSSVEPNSPTRCEESEQIEDTSLAEIEENSMEEVEEISESE